MKCAALHTAVLLTGGNLGDVVATIAAARAEVEHRVGAITAASEVYTSAPWGFGAAEGAAEAGTLAAVPDFLNQVLVVQTDLEPLDLLDQIQVIEDMLGRQRNDGNVVPAGEANRRRWPGEPSAASSPTEAGSSREAWCRSAQGGNKRKASSGSTDGGAVCLTEAGGVVAAPPRYNSRTMDIDILYYDDLVMESERLTIPHPLIARRAFVLRPLCDICPRADWAAALARLDHQGVRAFAGELRVPD